MSNVDELLRVCRDLCKKFEANERRTSEILAHVGKLVVPESDGSRASLSGDADSVAADEIRSGESPGLSPKDDIEALARIWFSEVWNNKNKKVIYELFAPDGVADGLGGTIVEGPDEFIEVFDVFHECFSLERWDLKDVYVSGDEVTVVTVATMVDRRSGTRLRLVGGGKAVVRNGQIVQATNHQLWFGPDNEYLGSLRDGDIKAKDLLHLPPPSGRRFESANQQRQLLMGIAEEVSASPRVSDLPTVVDDQYEFIVSVSHDNWTRRFAPREKVGELKKDDTLHLLVDERKQLYVCGDTNALSRAWVTSEMSVLLVQRQGIVDAAEALRYWNSLSNDDERRLEKASPVYEPAQGDWGDFRRAVKNFNKTIRAVKNFNAPVGDDGAPRAVFELNVHRRTFWLASWVSACLIRERKAQ